MLEVDMLTLYGHNSLQKWVIDGREADGML